MCRSVLCELWDLVRPVRWRYAAKFHFANYSQNIPITIDSVWINGVGVSLLAPSTFHWDIQSTGSETLPVVIPPLSSSDTLDVTFCPNIPAINANLMKIDTAPHRTPIRRDGMIPLQRSRAASAEMNFQPNGDACTVPPPTRVDTFGAQAESCCYYGSWRADQSRMAILS